MPFEKRSIERNIENINGANNLNWNTLVNLPRLKDALLHLSSVKILIRFL
jgi:hypothetical protein